MGIEPPTLWLVYDLLFLLNRSLISLSLGLYPHWTDILFPWNLSKTHKSGCIWKKFEYSYWADWEKEVFLSAVIWLLASKHFPHTVTTRVSTSSSPLISFFGCYMIVQTWNSVVVIKCLILTVQEWLLVLVEKYSSFYGPQSNHYFENRLTKDIVRYFNENICLLSSIIF